MIGGQERFGQYLADTRVVTGQTAELFPDGKITLGADWQSKQSTGRYDFVDEDTIRVRFKSSRPQEYNFALAGDNLKVTRADGTLVGDFTRVHRP